MKEQLICHLPRSCDSYPIELGFHIFEKNLPYLKTLASRFALIADDQVARLYIKEIKEIISSSSLDVYDFSFPRGEQNKTRETKEFLENQLFEKKLGRDTCIIALGGGVVTDMVGYLAATYCRGVPLILVPTSLLAMVDASIGGKTGVNVSYGKNMIGCIYQPKKVIVDFSFLKSLPKKELFCGLVEIIKHGLIADRSLFELVEENVEKIFDLDSDLLQAIVFKSCSIKNEIVQEDERENGKRRLLNFGHTIGHALEQISNYSLSHGEAVAMGLLAESYLSVRSGILDQTSFDRIRKLFMRCGYALKLPDFFAQKKMLETMILDKKSLKGSPRFVMIHAIGSSLSFEKAYCSPIPESLIIETIQWMKDALCCH